MPTNAASYSINVRRWARKTVPDRLVEIHRQIAFEAMRRIVLRTPVDSGRLRGNWWLTIDVIPVSERQVADPLALAIGRLTTLGPYKVVHITNNVPYGPIVERGGFIPKNPGPSKDPRPGRKGRVLVLGGFSVQAPQGMVSVTVRELAA